MIVDEAHYLRNSEGKSARGPVQLESFSAVVSDWSTNADDDRALSHKSREDIPAILSYVTDVDGARPDAL